MVGAIMLALMWRCDGSEGIKWYLRGILGGGSFYGEVWFQSADHSRRAATSVSGHLSPAECKRLADLVTVIRRQPPPAEPGPHFAALFERLSPTNAGEVRRLFEYHRGDEINSEPARAFVELAGLVERHLVPFYAKLTEPADAREAAALSELMPGSLAPPA
jgi:hypothetical protein